KYSIQGDVAYSRALVYLGKGKIDMNSMPDVAMTLAVTAPFTLGKTTITNIGNLRVKETDRLKALETELKKIGVNVETTFNSIIVLNSKFEIRNSKLINTYNDHRMAMCFAVMGTKIPGILIENPDCVNKTYPCFWRDLERAYLSPIHLGQKHLVLTGMRCSGKSHLGKRIAQHLNRPFVDLDKEIEKDQEMTVAEIVERKGWEYFRKVEQKICSVFAPLSSGKSFVPSVIATGGGVVLNPDNMEVFKKNAVNVFIFADLSVLAERLKKKKGSRPSLTGRDSEIELMEVWQKRRPLYLKYADVVWDNTSGETIKENLNFIF
ncbi:hypothetical protein COY07_03015, partial [Candidatus Peregrinibacteria bacterium CG_4_10_14_0_2_um_filter_43_11]